MTDLWRRTRWFVFYGGRFVDLTHLRGGTLEKTAVGERSWMP